MKKISKIICIFVLFFILLTGAIFCDAFLGGVNISNSVVISRGIGLSQIKKEVENVKNSGNGRLTSLNRLYWASMLHSEETKNSVKESAFAGNRTDAARLFFNELFWAEGSFESLIQVSKLYWMVGTVEDKYFIKSALSRTISCKTPFKFEELESRFSKNNSLDPEGLTLDGIGVCSRVSRLNNFDYRNQTLKELFNLYKIYWSDTPRKALKEGLSKEDQEYLLTRALQGDDFSQSVLIAYFLFSKDYDKGSWGA